jgi:hypothetical protein
MATMQCCTVAARFRNGAELIIIDHEGWLVQGHRCVYVWSIVEHSIAYMTSKQGQRQKGRNNGCGRSHRAIGTEKANDLMLDAKIENKSEK